MSEDITFPLNKKWTVPFPTTPPPKKKKFPLPGIYPSFNQIIITKSFKLKEREKKKMGGQCYLPLPFPAHHTTMPPPPNSLDHAEPCGNQEERVFAAMEVNQDTSMNIIPHLCR